MFSTESSLIKNLCKQLNKLNQKPLPYNPKINQASVAIIFKYNTQLTPFTQIQEKKLTKIKSCQDQNLKRNQFFQFLDSVDQQHSSNTIEPNPNIELLLIERSEVKGHRYSGQIGLPGGKIEKDETDLQACIREVQEETGIKLHNDYFLIGKLPTNFFAHINPKGIQTRVSVYTFFSLNSSEISIQPNLEEVSSAFWQPINYFWKFEKKSLKLVESVNLPTDLFFSFLRIEDHQIISEYVGDKDVTHDFYILWLPNNKPLWGLTSMFLHLLFSISIEGLNVDSRLNYYLSKSIKRGYKLDGKPFKKEIDDIVNILRYAKKLEDPKL